MKHTILYVDDDPEEGRLAESLGQAFEITTCSNAAEFNHAISHSAFTFDLALVDFLFEQGFKPTYKDGIAVTRALLDRHPEAQVIGLSRFLESSFTAEPGNKIADWLFAGSRWFCDKDDLFGGDQRLLQILTRWAEYGARLRSRLSTTVSAELGEYAGLADTVAVMNRLAVSPVPVLLTGETGTGKELIARRIHDMSQRSGPFVVGNCANLRGELAEVMLHGQQFHHNDPKAPGFPKKGWFEQAAGGTLFLDEIGDLPLEAQASLLRVLQEKQVRRVLGADWIPVDFRLVSATNRPLHKMAETGDFRMDLFFRLSVFQVQVPALAARRGDIPQLAARLLDRYQAIFGREIQLSPAVIDYLVERDYPGNVRELENVIQRIVVLAPRAEPSVDEIQRLDRLMLAPSADRPQDLSSQAEYAKAVAKWMREHLDELGTSMGYRSKTSFVRAAIDAIESTYQLTSKFAQTPQHVLTRFVKEVDPELYEQVVNRSPSRAGRDEDNE